MEPVKRIMLLHKESPQPAAAACNLKPWLESRGVSSEAVCASAETMELRATAAACDAVLVLGGSMVVRATLAVLVLVLGSSVVMRATPLAVLVLGSGVVMRATGTVYMLLSLAHHSGRAESKSDSEKMCQFHC